MLKQQTKQLRSSSNGKNYSSDLVVRLNGHANRNYTINISSESLHNLGKRLTGLKMPNRLVVITDNVILKKHGDRLKKSLKDAGFKTSIIEIHRGEEHKSKNTYFSIINDLMAIDDDNIGIVSFGGGVIGDVAGFVAGTFKRGVPYVQVPTTLLAQVDSAVGGKVGINWTNAQGGKNLVGRIYQPKDVLIDVSLLKTLPKRELVSGLAEVIKYGLIKDKDFFDFLNSEREKIFNLDPKVITHVVQRCCDIKREIVQQDELDDVTTKGIRALLNFGHTFGHALEAATAYKKYKHGEAISIGMVCAANLSQELGLITKSDCDAVADALSSYGLPITCDYKNLDVLIGHMKLDKKFTQKKTRFVVLKKLGEAVLHEGIGWDLVKKVYRSVLT